MAVRLQMKLGVVAEHDRLPDSPDTLVIVEPSVGSVARSKGPLYLLVTVADQLAPRARGDAPGRRDDPQRVLLRRVGRHPRLHPEGDRDREQAARPPGRPARPEVHRRQRPDRRRAGRRPRQRAVRGHGRAGRGLPDPPGPALDAARPAPRARPAVGRARAGRLARRDLGRRLARPRLARTSSRSSGPDELKDAMLTLHPQSAMEHLHHRFVADDGAGSDGAIAFEATEVSATARGRSPVPVKPPEPLAGAPDRSPIPLADNVQAAGLAVSAAAGSAKVAAGGAIGRVVRRVQDLMPRRKPAYRRVTPLASRRETQRRAALARARPRRGRRRPRPRACTSSAGPGKTGAIDSVNAGPGGARQGAREPRQGQGPGHRPRRGRPRTGQDAPDRGVPAARRGRAGERQRGASSTRSGRRRSPASTRSTASSRSPRRPLFTFKPAAGADADRPRRPGPGPGRRAVRPRPLDEDRLPHRPQGQEGDGRGPRRHRRPAAPPSRRRRFLAVGGQDLLILDSKNVLWRWRSSNATGKGTLVRVTVRAQLVGRRRRRPSGRTCRTPAAGCTSSTSSTRPSSRSAPTRRPPTAAASRPAPSGWLATARAVERHHLAASSTATSTRPSTGSSSSTPRARTTAGRPSRPATTCSAPPRPTRSRRGRTCRPTATRASIYVYDEPNARIIAIEKASNNSSGAYKAQYRLAGHAPGWEDLRGMVVTPGADGTPATRAVDLGRRAPPGVARGRPGRRRPARRPARPPRRRRARRPPRSRSRPRSRPRSRRAAGP